MFKKIAITSASLLSLSSLSMASTLFSENFDSYPVNTFPGNGWVLNYNGSGSGNQYVDNTHFTSGPNSLHLTGSSCWASLASHPVSLPAAPTNVTVTLTANVFIDQNVGGGCTSTIADVGLYNPMIGTWGTANSGIVFANDGYIYASSVQLMAWSPKTWYDTETITNFSTNTYDVYINGVLKASNIGDNLNTSFPTTIEVAAGHGYYPTAWFDDIGVSSSPFTPSVPEPSTVAIFSLGLAGISLVRRRWLA